MKKVTRKILKKLYRRHKTLTGIAQVLGCSVTHAGRLMQKHNLEYKHTTAKNYKTKNRAGYILTLVHGPRRKGATKWGYMYEHRIVMEQHLGRYLRRGEHVHHINGNKADNRIENLVLLRHQEHQSKHSKERWNADRNGVKSFRSAHRNQWSKGESK